MVHWGVLTLLGGGIEHKLVNQYVTVKPKCTSFSWEPVTAFIISERYFHGVLPGAKLRVKEVELVLRSQCVTSFDELVVNIDIHFSVPAVTLTT